MLIFFCLDQITVFFLLWLLGSNDITGFTATEKDLDMKGKCLSTLSTNYALLV